MLDMISSSLSIFPAGEMNSSLASDVSAAFVVNLLFRCSEFLQYLSSTSSSSVKMETCSMDDVLDVEIERWLKLSMQDTLLMNENFYELSSSVKFDENKSSTYWTSASEFRDWWNSDAMATYTVLTDDDSHLRSSVIAKVDIVKQLVQVIVQSFESSSLVLGPLDGIEKKFVPSYMNPLILAMLEPVVEKADSSKLLTTATLNTTAESSLETKYSAENETTILSRMFSGWTEFTRWSSYSSTSSSDSVLSHTETFNPVINEAKVGTVETAETSTDSITADSNAVVDDENTFEDSIDDEMTSLIL